MSEKKTEELKELWNNYNSDTKNADNEYDKFIEKYPKDDLKNLKLNNYTNIKDKEQDDYFTYFIERKTENCGKFRTASSFSYGVYKVNVNNITNDEEKKIAENKPYRSLEQKLKKELNDKYIDEEKAKEYFEKEVRPKLEKLADDIELKNLDDTKPLDINYARKVAYLYNPDKLIPLYKKDVIESIADFFGVEDVDLDSYKVTEKILVKIKESFDIQEESNFELTQKLANFLWKYFGKSVSFDSKNIIYYGAPGTGKTYTVYNAIKQKVFQAGDDIDEVALFTQFHPSFGYEDFIDGLKPYVNNGAVELKLINGIFKDFCKKAIENLKKSRENNETPKTYYFVADEINRAELSTVFGELLVCLEEDKRVNFDENGNLTDNSLLVETQNSYMDKEDSAVYFENGKCKFGIPSNLYFIGTMNDIDRSIDSFDLALRRRFIWERMDFDVDVIANSDKFKDIEPEDLEKYIQKCKDLNDYISKELGLGKSYEIGHAYFMDAKVHNKEISITAQKNLFAKKLRPLIEEYLRGEYSQNEIGDKINEAKKRFID